MGEAQQHYKTNIFGIVKCKCYIAQTVLYQTSIIIMNFSLKGIIIASFGPIDIGIHMVMIRKQNLQNKIYLNKWIENLLLSTTSPSNSVGCIKEACKIELDVLSIEEKESLPSNFFD